MQNLNQLCQQQLYTRRTGERTYSSLRGEKAKVTTFEAARQWINPDCIVSSLTWVREQIRAFTRSKIKSQARFQFAQTLAGKSRIGDQSASAADSKTYISAHIIFSACTKSTYGASGPIVAPELQKWEKAAAVAHTLTTLRRFYYVQRANAPSRVDLLYIIHIILDAGFAQTDLFLHKEFGSESDKDATVLLQQLRNKSKVLVLHAIVLNQMILQSAPGKLLISS